MVNGLQRKLARIVLKPKESRLEAFEAMRLMNMMEELRVTKERLKQLESLYVRRED